MVQRTVEKALRVGRATTSLVGLAVVLALCVGVASTALAGTGVGATLNLGNTNTVNAVSKLVGSVAGPSFQVDNNSTNANATALDLRVEAGKAPMTVNSGAKVANLNSDKIDGQDSSAFMPASTYRVDRPVTLDFTFSGAVLCDPGDLALSGAWANKDATTEIVTATPSIVNPGAVTFLVESDSPLIENMTLMAVCADLPPLR